MSFPIGKAVRTTLRESVADRVRTAILDGSIAAGTHLGEVNLSDSLGVSRATLREALRQLQEEGLAVQDGRGRVSVREVTSSEVKDLFEVRLGLEQRAALRICAMAAQDRPIRALRERLSRLRVQEPLATGLEADLDFHEFLCAASGNQLLLRTWRGLSGLVRLTMISAGPVPARQNMAYERHLPIVDLLEQGDAVGVSQFLEMHMRSASDLIIDGMP